MQEGHHSRAAGVVNTKMRQEQRTERVQCCPQQLAPDPPPLPSKCWREQRRGAHRFESETPIIRSCCSLCVCVCVCVCTCVWIRVCVDTRVCGHRARRGCPCWIAPPPPPLTGREATRMEHGSRAFSLFSCQNFQS